MQRDNLGPLTPEKLISEKKSVEINSNIRSIFLYFGKNIVCTQESIPNSVAKNSEKPYYLIKFQPNLNE